MGHQAVFVRVHDVSDSQQPAPRDLSWGRGEHPTTGFSVGLWPAPPTAAALTAAVGAPSPGGARRLAEALEREGILVGATFDVGDEIALDRLAPTLDVLVLAAGIGETAAEHALRNAHKALHPAAIVVVSPRSGGRHLLRYLEWGADGVVFADELETTLSAAIRNAVAGQISVPRSMRGLLAPPALSQREKEVLELAACGLTNRQIAAKLFLAESTVKTHLSAAFRRLGVNSRREAAAIVCATDSATRRLLLPVAPQRTNGGGTTWHQMDDRHPPERGNDGHIQRA
jgi:DNA-binding NarL/FixJ family response regulator